MSLAQGHVNLTQAYLHPCSAGSCQLVHSSECKGSRNCVRYHHFLSVDFWEVSRYPSLVLIYSQGREPEAGRESLAGTAHRPAIFSQGVVSVKFECIGKQRLYSFQAFPPTQPSILNSQDSLQALMLPARSL